MKKYEVTNETVEFYGRTLRQIRALKSFNDDVKKGDLGGYVEKESNLSQSGNAWISSDAQVYGDSKFAKEYLALADLAEIHFGEAGEE